MQRTEPTTQAQLEKQPALRRNIPFIGFRRKHHPPSFPATRFVGLPSTKRRPAVAFNDGRCPSINEKSSQLNYTQNRHYAHNRHRPLCTYISFTNYTKCIDNIGSRKRNTLLLYLIVTFYIFSTVKCMQVVDDVGFGYNDGLCMHASLTRLSTDETSTLGWSGDDGNGPRRALSSSWRGGLVALHPFATLSELAPRGKQAGSHRQQLPGLAPALLLLLRVHVRGACSRASRPLFPTRFWPVFQLLQAVCPLPGWNDDGARAWR